MTTYSRNEQANLDIVNRALASSSADFAKFFDIFVDDVEWTLAGYGPVAGTYTSKKQLFREAEEALFARFASPLTIKVLGTWADGDHVFARIKSSTTAIDQRPYHNEYMYIMTMRDGRVVSGIEWLDFHAYYEIIERIKL